MKSIFDDGTLPKHPATYTATIVECIAEVLDAEFAGRHGELRVLDPMAGTGKIFDLIPGYTWYGVDLEQWEGQDARVDIGDATALGHADGWFDAGVVSPTYGNGFADHHIPKDASTRVSYFHRIHGAGRTMDPRNSGWFHFGGRGSKRETAKYKLLHMKAWREVYRVLKPGGVFVLNVKNFYVKGEEVDVCTWHRDACLGIGFELLEARWVPVPGLKYGDAKTLKRVDHETVYVFRKPAAG